MLDFATLTGAVIVALGHRASGIMGNDKTLISKIKKASDNTGEKVWELPLWDDYSKDIKSKNYQKGICCPNCYKILSKEKKKRLIERNKQIEIAKRKGIYSPYIQQTPLNFL